MIKRVANFEIDTSAPRSRLIDGSSIVRRRLVSIQSRSDTIYDDVIAVNVPRIDARNTRVSTSLALPRFRSPMSIDLLRSFNTAQLLRNSHNRPFFWNCGRGQGWLRVIARRSQGCRNDVWKLSLFFLEKIIFVDGKLLIRYHHFEVGFNFFLV